MNAKYLAETINHWNKILVGCLLALLILDVWVGVLDRYLLHFQLAWVEELARYIMIWTILMAIPIAMFQRQHISLELLTANLSPAVMKPLNLINKVIVFLFFSYIAYSGTFYASKGLEQLSTVFGMPMAVPYAAIPVSFGLTAVQVFLQILGGHEPLSTDSVSENT